MCLLIKNPDTADANDDVMVGTWLLGHNVHRARFVAKEYLDMWYQTSLSQCFPFYMNQKVRAKEG